ncbi:hypothetical protein D3C80_1234680 [compost metagenome]
MVVVIHLHAIRGKFPAGVCDIPFHRPALLHFERTGDELVGADHLRGIERDTGFSFNQYHRHGCHNRIRRSDVGGLNPGHGERPVFRLILNDRPVRKGDMKRIWRGRRRGMVIRENTG